MEIKIKLNPDIFEENGSHCIVHSGMGIYIQGSTKKKAAKMFMHAVEMLLKRKYETK